MENKEFYRRAVKVGNSAGILLPKSLLGAEVSVKVVKPAVNVKKDILKLLDNLLEEVGGIYILNEPQKKENKNIKQIFKRGLKSEKNAERFEDNSAYTEKNIEKSKRKIEVIAVSMSLSKILETQDYHLTIMPLNMLKKLAKDKPDFSQRLFHSKPLMNKWLLIELRKEISY